MTTSARTRRPTRVALGRTWLGAWQQAWSNRRSFWFQTLIMMLNDLVWIVFWIVFFRRVGEVRGWDINNLMVLQAILTTSGGIVLGLLANARRIPELATTGGLDAALALPVPTLPYLLVREVQPINVGDLAFGLGLFAVAGNPTPARTLAFAVAVVIATVLLASFLVLTGSSVFFLGRTEAGDLGFHAITLFSSYPVDVFGGLARVVMFTVVPAGFVTGLPSKWVESFDPKLALASAAVATGFAVAAVLSFNRGLRHYTSGAVWTDA